MNAADVLIVGARCAGAPLATWLARGGARVHLVDAAALPSDQTSSTHLMQPYGLALLDELGVGDAVRAITSPLRRLVFSLEEHTATVDFGDRYGICPRREALDHILLEEARRAGAEVSLETRVVDVLREGDRIVGVVVDRHGEKSELRAPMVVGADGRRSTIARLVEAEEYDAFDAPRALYWGYWQRPDGYDTDEATRENAFLRHIGDTVRICSPTATDQLLVGITLPLAALEAWRGDVSSSFLSAIREDPFLRDLLGDAEPIGKIYGVKSERYFFRQAAGPGWALVGDAGLHKDPHPGLGISDALRDARSLSRAILEGSDAALERYWRERDVASIDLYHFARDLGEPGYNNPLNQVVMGRIGASPELSARFREVLDRELSPYALLPASTIVGCAAGQLLRGRFGVLGPFFQGGRRAGQVGKARRRCEQLLERVQSTAPQADAGTGAAREP